MYISDSLVAEIADRLAMFEAELLAQGYQAQAADDSVSLAWIAKTYKRVASTSNDLEDVMQEQGVEV